MLDSDWDAVRLVVFDVDGTLYAQAPLRWRMARDMALDAAARRSLTAIRVVGTYRRLREAAGVAGKAGFEQSLTAEVAGATGVPQSEVRGITEEWLERRPLRYLGACRYPGLPALFDGLRQAGIAVAALSDYPARAKLAALGLVADPVVWAGDPGVDRLKPDPRGLLAVIEQVGATPATTVLIGDRPDRDGEAARRAGARALIRSTRPHPGWDCFRGFDAPVFRRFLHAGSLTGRDGGQGGIRTHGTR